MDSYRYCRVCGWNRCECCRRKNTVSDSPRCGGGRGGESYNSRRSCCCKTAPSNDLCSNCASINEQSLAEHGGRLCWVSATNSFMKPLAYNFRIRWSKVQRKIERL